MLFLKSREVLNMIGVSRATLWRMVRTGEFPRPVRVTERNRGHLLESIEAWMRARAEGRPWDPFRVGQTRADGISPSTGRSVARLAQRRTG
jgi:predicted DNA-binding transcriptional regulator AlpA